MSRVARHTMKAAVYRLIRFSGDRVYTYAAPPNARKAVRRAGVVFVPGKHSA